VKGYFHGRSGTARQQEIMCDYQVDRIFSEKISGANKERPQLRAMLDYVREGIEIAKAQGKYTGRNTSLLALHLRAAIPTVWGDVTPVTEGTASVRGTLFQKGFPR